MIIFRKNWYEKVGDWIRYACRVQNFGLPVAAYSEIARRQSNRII